MNLLTVRLLRWFCSPARLLAICLLLAVAASALWVTYTAYLTRSLYQQMQTLGKASDELEHEYHRLLLEQSAKSDYTKLLQRLEQKQLTMVVPTPSEVVVIND